MDINTYMDHLNKDNLGVSKGNSLRADNTKDRNTKKSSAANYELSDEYVPTPKEKDITYKKPINKVDTSTIQRLKAESEQAHSQLREIVRQLLERQGLTFKDLAGFDKEIKVDEKARLEAQAAIEDDGIFSPESVSNRIVEFAIAISGGDKSKIDTLKEAIDKGFGEAAKALGGSLPEISQTTYDLIMEKLDNWVNE